MLQSEAKKRAEAAEVYEQAGRAESAAKERAELAVIERYLPAAMSDDDLQAIVSEEVANAAASGAEGQRAMGQVIKAVRERAGAAADGSRIAAMVKWRSPDPYNAMIGTRAPFDPAESRVGGQHSALESFGDRHVAGVVGRHAVAQLPDAAGVRPRREELNLERREQLEPHVGEWVGETLAGERSYDFRNDGVRSAHVVFE